MAAARGDTLLGIMKDNSESMARSAANAAYAMPKVYSILAPSSLNRTVANGECYRVALSQRNNFGFALHARTLLDNDKLSSIEIASRFGKQNRNLKRKNEISVHVLMQAIKVALHVLQKQRGRSVLTLIVAFL